MCIRDRRRAIAVGNIAVAHSIDFLHGLARGGVDGVDLHGAASVLDMADAQRVVRDDQVATGVVCEIGGAGVAVMGLSLIHISGLAGHPLPHPPVFHRAACPYRFLKG